MENKMRASKPRVSQQEIDQSPILQMVVQFVKVIESQHQRDEKADKLAFEIRRQGAEQDHVLRLLSSLAESVGDLHRRQDSLEEAGRREEKLSEEFFSHHVIVPLAKGLFSTVDLVAQHSRNREQSCSGTPALLQGIKAQLLSALGNLKIETLIAKPGDTFDPSWMQPVETLDARSGDRGGTVASLVRLGFKRGTHLLRPAGVTVFKSLEPVPTSNSELSTDTVSRN